MKTENKEIRNRRILALIAVLVIGFAYVVSGQVNVYNRYDNRPDIKTMSPEQPIEFGVVGSKKGDADNFFVNMYIDKITKDSSNARIFVYMNNKIDISKYELIVKFADGSFKKLERSLLTKKDNYAEYIVDQDALDRFYWMRAESFLFKAENSNDNIASPLNHNDSFFFHFLHLCYK